MEILDSDTYFQVWTFLLL